MARPKRSEVETPARERILDAAETLFGESGMHGASLSEIARSADVDIKLISYYFKDRSALFLAIVDRRFTQSNALRMRMLADLQRLHAGGQPPVAEIVRTMIHPIVQYRRDLPADFDKYVRLLTREYTSPESAQAFKTYVSEMFGHYGDILRKAIPSMSHADAMFVLHLAYSAILMISTYTSEGTLGPNGVAGSLQDIEDRLVRSITAAAKSFA